MPVVRVDHIRLRLLEIREHRTAKERVTLCVVRIPVYLVAPDAEAAYENEAHTVPRDLGVVDARVRGAVRNGVRSRSFVWDGELCDIDRTVHRKIDADLMAGSGQCALDLCN